jgi:hypothetical protein
MMILFKHVFRLTQENGTEVCIGKPSRMASGVIEATSTVASPFRGGEAEATGMSWTLNRREKVMLGVGGSLYNPRCARVGPPAK